MKKDIRGKELYVILDTGYIPLPKMAAIAERVVEGGCRLIQLRDKISQLEDILKTGKEIKKVLPSDVIFILNDFVQGALEIGADGVHLGQDDMPVSLARKSLGSEAIIGLSTHSYAQAIASSRESADYIGFGPIFKTKTKPKALPIGIKDLPRLKGEVPHPIFAIGGISEINAEKVISAGANGIAVVSAILESKNIENTVRRLLEKIKGQKGVYHEKEFAR